MPGLRHIIVPRRTARRWAAILAIIAMIGQIAIFTLHRPALALSPFDGDDHALCLSGASGSPPPDDGRSGPVGDDLQCPICKTLHHGVAILPPETGLIGPVLFITIEIPRSACQPLLQASWSAQPRAPPLALDGA